MRAALGIALMLVVCAAVGGYVRAQDARLRTAEAHMAERDTAIGALTAANAAQAATIMELREGRERDDALAADTADKIDRLATRIRNLDRRTQEALKHAPDLTIGSLLPAAAADALCLQWHAASGRAGSRAASDPADAADALDARAGHTAAAGRGAATAGPDCSSWRSMTVRDAVEWNGLLLRHAGLEREDKAALRAWAARGSK